MNVKYTEMAVQAISLADLFQMAFKEPLKGALAYRIALATPDGPSTSGGRQATQHINLIPVGEGVTLVMGAANAATKVAELRTFEHLAQIHALRFGGAELPLAKADYDKLLAKMESFFKSQGLVVTITQPPEQASAGGKSMLPLLLAGAGAGLVIVATALYLFLR